MSIRAEILRDKKKGFKVYEYGDRLSLWNPVWDGSKELHSPMVTKHLSDKEFADVKDLVDGVHMKRI